MRMAVRNVGVMSGGLVVTIFVVLGGFAMMLGCMLVVLGRFGVMLCCLC